MFVTWNAACLLALLLHSISSACRYLFEEVEPKADVLLAVRVMQGSLTQLQTDLISRKPPPSLLEAFQHVKDQIDIVAEKLNQRTKEAHAYDYEKLSSLLSVPYLLPWSPSIRRVNASLLWSQRNAAPGEFAPQVADKCVHELFSSSTECKVSLECARIMMNTKGLSNYNLCKQIRYLAFTNQRTPCRRSFLSRIKEFNNSTIGGEELIQQKVSSLCSNAVHELDQFMTRRMSAVEDLPYLTANQVDMLAEYVFACGQVQFVDATRALILHAILATQDSEKGCWLEQLATPKVRVTKACSPSHTASSLSALSIFLRLTLDRGAWAQFHLIDRAVGSLQESSLHSLLSSPTLPLPSIHNNQTMEIDYRKWADRASVDFDMPPPPLSAGGHADALLFVLLLAGILLVCAVVQKWLSPQPKPLYPYAYKKM